MKVRSVKYEISDAGKEYTVRFVPSLTTKQVTVYEDDQPFHYRPRFMGAMDASTAKNILEQAIKEQ